MGEKIEVRIKDNGGHVTVTRCDEGIAWVEVRRADGTTPEHIRLTMSERADLALILCPDLTPKNEVDNLREKYDAACRSSVANSEAAYNARIGIRAAEARADTWEKEALLRAENHERLTAVAKVFVCPAHDVVAKAELAVETYGKLRATLSEGDVYVAGETWKQRDARHRETIHQLKQENHNLRTKRGEAEEKLRAANQRSPYQVLVKECPTQAEAAHVMSLTKQLEDAQEAHRFCESTTTGWIQTCQTWKAKYDKQCAKVEELERAGKILAEQMQPVKHARDDLQDKIDTWRKELTELLGFAKPTYFDQFVTKIRELKAAAEVNVLLREALEKKNQADPRLALLESERDGLKDTLGHWRKDLAEVLGLDTPAVWSFATFIMKIRELKVLAMAESEVRRALENKHRDYMAIKADHAKMLELRKGDQETVKRCSDRVKELEHRAMVASAALDGRNAR